MAKATISIKQGDSGISFASSLGVNLTDATVRFVIAGGKGGSADIADAPDGIVSYTFATDDTQDAGTFKAEWEVTYADATVQTFPADGYHLVKVYRELG